MISNFSPFIYIYNDLEVLLQSVTCYKKEDLTVTVTQHVEILEQKCEKQAELIKRLEDLLRIREINVRALQREVRSREELMFPTLFRN